MNVSNLSLSIVFLTAGLIGCASAGKYEPPTEMNLENLAKIALSEEFTPGREIVVSYVEIPPNTEMDRHWHPGEEFHYYLEGDIEIRIDGEPPFDGIPGTVGHVPFKKMHTAVTGPKGGRVLVFRVHTSGKPVRFLEDGGQSDR
ncbi:MAG: cupin domain-containing protein [Planctomycetota bacterium]|nr:cupin domain-containing protein [Planctomycetota bacterium]